MLSQQIDKFSDNRGSLFAMNKLPFDPKRIFYVRGVPAGQTRGKHAHYKNKQILVCLSGKIEVKLDNGKSIEKIVICENESVFVDNLVWDEQTYMTNSDILLSICSTEHDESDYIRDYDAFLKAVGENK